MSGQSRGHGHVIPNPDGSKARCGGPPLCRECALEQAQEIQRRRSTVDPDIAAAAIACKRTGVSDPSLMQIFDLTANELAAVLEAAPIEVVEIEAPAARETVTLAQVVVWLREIAGISVAKHHATDRYLIEGAELEPSDLVELANEKRAAILLAPFALKR